MTIAENVPDERGILSGGGKKQLTPREAAIWSYIRWVKLKTRIDVAVEKELKRAKWEPRDKALFHEIIYGVVRQHGRLEWLIKQLTTTREKPDPSGVAAVAVGLYQILFLDRVPDYALVDTSVEVAKRISGPLVGGWVNAVLRRATVDKDVLLAMLPDQGVQKSANRLSVEFSYPEWMITRWSSILKPDDLRKFLEWGNRRPQLTVRVNKLNTTVEEFTKLLNEKEVKSTVHPDFPEFLTIDHSGDSGWIESLAIGKVSAQDISQGLVARILNPQPGEEILDFCSAPGGKTGHLAEIAPEALIFATDKAEERLENVRELVQRNGYENVRIVAYDDIVRSKKKFDAILVDAPCSGTGVLARRPDLRWRRSPDDIRRMSSVQLSLLNYAADRLKSNGRIVYSTCSVEPEENDGVVNRFLEERSDFEDLSVQGSLPDSIKSESKRLNLWGTEIGADGVFVAVLKKKQSNESITPSI